MCIMQDDGKAMQAFRPGHSTQVLLFIFGISKYENFPSNTVEVSLNFDSFELQSTMLSPNQSTLVSGGDQGREGALPDPRQRPRLRPLQAPRAPRGGDAPAADGRRGGAGVCLPVQVGHRAALPDALEGARRRTLPARRDDLGGRLVGAGLRQHRMGLHGRVGRRSFQGNITTFTSTSDNAHE